MFREFPINPQDWKFRDIPNKTRGKVPLALTGWKPVSLFMTLTEARTRLSTFCSAATYPALADDDLDSILSECLSVDSEGRLIDESAYQTTYDLLLAAKKAWEAKAAKVSADHNFNAADQGFERSQVFEMCIAMRDLYARKINARIAPKIDCP